jgi:chromosome partitioning protein
MAGAIANVITLANIKGGVGKTTATTNLAYLFATQYGKRVLVIDSDDQANTTKALGVRGKFRRDSQTLWAGMQERRTYREVMVQSPYDNLWVVPATKDLRKAQLAFGQSARGFKLFKHLLQGVESDFDLVLVDTKPQVNILLQASLAASHWYLIPSFPESDSYDGFVDLVAECEEIWEEENPRLNCLGLFFTCMKRAPAHETYFDFVVKLLADARIPVFPAHIRASNAVATGSLHSIPAVALKNSRHLRLDYMKIAEHILNELKQDARGRPRRRPDLKRIGLLEEQMAPGRSARFEISTGEDEDDDQLFAAN